MTHPNAPVAIPRRDATSTAASNHASAFRADADATGRWFVWRRLGASGWSAWRQCTSRADAVHLAASLNRQPPAVPA